METTEKNLSHDESMQIIQSMIGMAKNKVSEDGFHFLLWGTLIVIASIANYLWLTVWPTPYNSLPWLVMPLVGSPLAIIYERRKKATEKVKTHLDKYYGFLWMSFGITLFCVIYFAVLNRTSPIPFILALVGLATFVSGSIFDFNALRVGGIVFWVSGFVAAYVDPSSQLLVNAGATFIGYVIPGVLLWRNYKAQSDVQTT